MERGIVVVDDVNVLNNIFNGGRIWLIERGIIVVDNENWLNKTLNGRRIVVMDDGFYGGRNCCHGPLS